MKIISPILGKQYDYKYKLNIKILYIIWKDRGYFMSKIFLINLFYKSRAKKVTRRNS